MGTITRKNRKCKGKYQSSAKVLYPGAMTTPEKTWMQLTDGCRAATAIKARVFTVAVCIAVVKRENMCLSSRSSRPSFPAPCMLTMREEGEDRSNGRRYAQSASGRNSKEIWYLPGHQHCLPMHSGSVKTLQHFRPLGGIYLSSKF